jgi:hypothetical protein
MPPLLGELRSHEGASNVKRSVGHGRAGCLIPNDESFSAVLFTTVVGLFVDAGDWAKQMSFDGRKDARTRTIYCDEAEKET